MKREVVVPTEEDAERRRAARMAELFREVAEQDRGLLDWLDKAAAPPHGWPV